jgi:hypothetical protein
MYYKNENTSKLKLKIKLGMVVHTSNPIYSGGRDQEDCTSSQPRQRVCEIMSRKNPSQKGLVSGSRCRPWVQTSLLGEKHTTNPLKIIVLYYIEIQAPFCFVLFLAVLGFENSGPHTGKADVLPLGLCPSPFLFNFSNMVSNFCSGAGFRLWSFHLCFLVPGITDMHHQARSHTFCPS